MLVKERALISLVMYVINKNRRARSFKEIKCRKENTREKRIKPTKYIPYIKYLQNSEPPI